MQSAKFLAIAALAIVVMPIGLGYAFAFEEVEKTGWTTSKEYNLTNSILNASLPYYMASTAPINNAMLLDGLQIVSPVYNSVTSTPSSLPIFTPTTATVENSAAQSVTAMPTVNASQIILDDRGLTTSGGSTTLSSNAYDVYLLRFPSTADLYVNGSAIASMSGAIVTKIVVDGVNRWIITGLSGLDDVNPILNDPINSGYFSIGSAGAITLSYLVPVQITNDYWTIYSQISQVQPIDFAYLGVKLVKNDGTSFIDAYAGGFRAIGSGSNVTITGITDEMIGGVTAAYYYKYGGTVNFSTLAVNPGEYADPSEGWRFPAAGGVYHSAGVWSNGADNQSVMMLIHRGPALGNASVKFGLWSSWNAPTNFDILEISTIVKINGQTVPNFNLSQASDLMVKFGVDAIEISVIDSWPAMHSEPTVYRSVSVDRQYRSEIFAINADVQDYNDTYDRYSFRVDSADVFAGSYPATEDATLDISKLFAGNVPYMLDLKSIGIYGNSISIGPVDYPVTDGSITVDGKSYRLLDLKISVTPGDGDYIVSFNGTDVSRSVSFPLVTFGGVWSLSVIGWLIEPITTMSFDWIPGKWSFWDSNAVPIVGIITAIGIFIALALCRPFSGSKILMLTLICGGAGIIFLLIS